MTVEADASCSEQDSPDESVGTEAVGVPHLSVEADVSCSKQHSPDDSADLYSDAADLKVTGNAFFKMKRWQDAVRSYEAAVETIFAAENCSVGEGRDLLIAVHANLAQCYLNLELYRRAIMAATECLKLDSDNQKALFRRAVAHEHLEEAAMALADLDAILRIDPDHQQAKAARTQLIVRQAALAAEGGTSTWFQGLAVRDRYEWFVDCYRLRLHDDCAAGNPSSHFRGLYVPDAKLSSVVEDWLVFCKLAALCDVLPKDWSWQSSLEVASQPVCSFWGTDEADRKASAAKTQLMRAVADRIYGDGARTEATQEIVRGAVSQAVDPNLVVDLGGAAVWQRLLKRMPDPAEAREAAEAAEIAEFDEGF